MKRNFLCGVLHLSSKLSYESVGGEGRERREIDETFYCFRKIC